MSERDKTLYGKLSFTCIFDLRCRPRFSDNQQYFTDLLSSHEFKRALKERLLHQNELNYYKEGMRYYCVRKTIKYQNVVVPLAYDLFLCMTYPEDLYTNVSYSAVYEQFYKINHESIDAITIADRIKEAVMEEKDKEKLVECVTDLVGHLTNVREHTIEIFNVLNLKRFNNYCMIKNILKKLKKAISLNNGSRYQNIDLKIDFVKTVANINEYMIRDVVLNVVKIVMVSVDEDAAVDILVTGRGGTVDGNINVHAYVPETHITDLRKLNDFIDIAKLTVMCFDGTAKFDVTENTLLVDINIPAPLSDYKHRVEKSRVHYSNVFNDGIKLSGKRSEKIDFSEYEDFSCTLEQPSIPIEVDIDQRMTELILSDVNNDIWSIDEE